MPAYTRHMLKHILLFLCLAVGSYAAGNSPVTHTDIYQKWKAGNFTKTLFLPDTYLPFDSYPMNRDVACQKLSDDQIQLRRQYVNLLKQAGINCTVDWCINGQFYCGSSSAECYQVEHIIDKVNSDPELDGLDVNIVGNLVMAYSKWNQQVGQLKWDNVVAEKQEIYTTFLFQKARHFVLTCNQPSTSTDISSMIGMVLGSAILIVICIALYFVMKLKPRSPEYQNLSPQEEDMEDMDGHHIPDDDDNGQ